MAHQKFEVLLAAPSLLYAPIYLAKQLEITDIFRHIELKYAPPLEKNRDPDDPQDPLISRTIKERKVLLGIGDPLRLADMPDFYDDALSGKKARLIGGLILQAEYWAFARTSQSNGNRLETFNRIFVPDARFTGYSLACNYLSNYASATGVKIDTLAPKLKQAGLLGRPQPWFDLYLDQCIQQNGWSEDWCYLTPNPSSSDCQLCYFQNDIYNSAAGKPFLMTGLFTDDKHLDDYRDQISEFVYGVTRAIRRLNEKHFTDLAVDALCSYAGGDERFRQLVKGRATLERSLNNLNVGSEDDAPWNLHPELKFDKVALDNALDIRRSTAPFAGRTKYQDDKEWNKIIESLTRCFEPAFQTHSFNTAKGYTLPHLESVNVDIVAGSLPLLRKALFSIAPVLTLLALTLACLDPSSSKELDLGIPQWLHRFDAPDFIVTCGRWIHSRIAPSFWLSGGVNVAAVVLFSCRAWLNSPTLRALYENRIGLGLRHQFLTTICMVAGGCCFFLLTGGWSAMIGIVGNFVGVLFVFVLYLRARSSSAPSIARSLRKIEKLQGKVIALDLWADELWTRLDNAGRKKVMIAAGFLNEWQLFWRKLWRPKQPNEIKRDREKRLLSELKNELYRKIAAESERP